MKNFIKLCDISCVRFRYLENERFIRIFLEHLKIYANEFTRILSEISPVLLNILRSSKTISRIIEVNQVRTCNKVSLFGNFSRTCLSLVAFVYSLANCSHLTSILSTIH